MKSLLLLAFLSTALAALAAPSVDYSVKEGESAEAARQQWHAAMKGENLALGRRVTFSNEPRYPLTRSESDRMDLTDGELAPRKDDRIWFNQEAVGWTDADRGVTLMVDLEEVQPVGGVAIRLLGGREQSGLVFPARIEVIASEDGRTFHTITSKTKVTFSEKQEAEQAPDRFFYLPEEGRAYVATFEFSLECKARYVGLVITSSGAHLFSDELAILSAAPEAKMKALAQFPERVIVNRGIAMLPRGEEIMITTNVVTPNWFAVTDVREERTPVSFALDLPPGVSLEMGEGRAEHQPQPDYPNRWIISDLYRGKSPAFRPVFGPFYFIIQPGQKLGPEAKIRVTPLDEESGDNVREFPVVGLEIPALPSLAFFDLSLSWFEEHYQYSYPSFFNDFRKLGFNTVSTFPRNHLSEDRREKLHAFVKASRENGYKVLYNESPFHVMWNRHQDQPEVRNQLKGGPGNKACPSYTGKYYQEEIARVAAHSKEIQPDYLFFDIEFWDEGARESVNCTRCQEHYRASGAKDWKSFLIAQGTRMQHDLRQAIAGTTPTGGMPLTGIYAADAQHDPYHQVHSITAIFPNEVDLIQPCYYNQGNVKAVHEGVRANYRKFGQRAQIPWLTAGTYGTFPPHKLEAQILEVMLNGGRGVTYYAFWDFDPIHFYHHAKAFSLLAPFEKLFANGQAITVEGSAQELLYTAFGTAEEALLLLTNETAGEVKTKWNLPGRELVKVRDLMSGEELAITAGEGFSVPPDRQRLLHLHLR